ncbi:TfoX/Sxy family protein [Actinomycetaceae bacterium MB13-C1-2]|nr:TfoX/Sxy family protein [Actinomycetaceae bacterium MB13-C1-2]
MSSSPEFLEYVLDLLSETSNVRHRKMMGEYVLYSDGKVFGGIYDGRFLVKQTEASRRLLPEAALELPYPEAKLMFLVDIENRDRIAEVVAEMLPELPLPKARKKH